MPPPDVVDTPPLEEGKNAASEEGDESKPSWLSMSETSSDVTVPVFDRSSTANDSLMLWSCCGGILDSGSLLLSVLAAGAGGMAGLVEAMFVCVTVLTVEVDSLERKFGRAIGDVNVLSSSIPGLDGLRVGEASEEGVTADLSGDVCVGVPALMVEGERPAGDAGR